MIFQVCQTHRLGALAASVALIRARPTFRGIQLFRPG
jgi:hypothetical protein